ncbi:hypothetical protein [Reticulibacter mediterranei]|uniref:hypothetical protein n=1 Tax=Reticulibacter mediterranei TaxID=2778369 RepID=UPI001C68EF6C|nr:hypothetical protein [Reticulibacter mediterranei]
MLNPLLSLSVANLVLASLQDSNITASPVVFQSLSREAFHYYFVCCSRVTTTCTGFNRSVAKPAIATGVCVPPKWLAQCFQSLKREPQLCDQKTRRVSLLLVNPAVQICCYERSLSSSVISGVA